MGVDEMGVDQNDWIVPTLSASHFIYSYLHLLPFLSTPISSTPMFFAKNHFNLLGYKIGVTIFF